MVNAPKTNVLAVAAFSETPEQIKSEIKINDLGSLNFKEAKKIQLSIREILDFASWHPQMERRQRDWLETKLHDRFATPWTCLVVVLIAIPFGAPSGRRNVFVGVASSIVICFAYFVLKEFSLALGSGGHVAPWLAAWLPNLLFGGMGVWLTMRVR